MSEPITPRANSADLPMPPITSAASSSSAHGVGATEGRSAGQLLRQARQAQGLHVAALAAAIKVTPAKLEALEAERFEELPDPTFARALALAVCRYLKIDAEPVLSRLPQPRAHRLEHIHRGLATPFRDDQDSRDQGDLGAVMRPAVLAPVLVLLAALVVWVAPDSWWKFASLRGTSGGTEIASSEVSGNAGIPPAVTEDAAPSAQVAPERLPPSTSASSPVPSPPSAISASPAAAAAPVIAALTGKAGAANAPKAADASPSSSSLPSPVSPVPMAAPSGTPGDGALVITATAESWVEVIDAQGRTLFSRSIPAGQSVDLDGPAPLKLRVGNIAGTQVTFRGQKVALTSPTNSNVARLELK